MVGRGVCRRLQVQEGADKGAGWFVGGCAGGCRWGCAQEGACKSAGWLVGRGAGGCRLKGCAQVGYRRGLNGLHAGGQ
jgi:hypothetical protein